MNHSYVQTIFDETINTVGVSFSNEDTAFNQAKLYTFKTRLKLEEGDKVIVRVKNKGLIIATVGEVHDIPNIEENSSHDYTWIIQKVDLDGEEELLEEDKKHKKHVRTMQRQRHREAVKEQLKETYTLEVTSED